MLCLFSSYLLVNNLIVERGNQLVLINVGERQIWRNMLFIAQDHCLLVLVFLFGFQF